MQMTIPPTLCRSLLPWLGLLMGLMACTHTRQATLPVAFPAAWAGTWAGDLCIYTGATPRDTVAMELSLAPTDDSLRWQWTLRYLAAQPDERAYHLLLPADSLAPYRIDEGDGILLDAWRRGPVLSSRFSVSNSLLLVNYHFLPGQITLEVWAGPTDRAATTGDTTGTYIIRNWPLGVYQRAVLTRRP
ncbi:MAG: hypothetical protein OHK0039_42360 [Bacteroidia bacterium]